MTIERTFSIIKPNAVKKNVIGAVQQYIENAGLHIIAMKMVHLTEEQASGFYAEHEGKAFFQRLIAFMTSGPIVVQVLEGENAIAKYRQVMGPTDLTQAAKETIRANFADNVTENAVHGSDSTESAAREIAYFFADSEICAR